MLNARKRGSPLRLAEVSTIIQTYKTCTLYSSVLPNFNSFCNPGLIVKKLKNIETRIGFRKTMSNFENPLRVSKNSSNYYSLSRKKSSASTYKINRSEWKTSASYNIKPNTSHTNSRLWVNSNLLPYILDQKQYSYQ